MERVLGDGFDAGRDDARPGRRPLRLEEIHDPADGTHFAKFGVTGITDDAVNIIWAYQTIGGLQELAVPEKPDFPDTEPLTISF